MTKQTDRICRQSAAERRDIIAFKRAEARLQEIENQRPKQTGFERFAYWCSRNRVWLLIVGILTIWLFGLGILLIIASIIGFGFHEK